MNLPLPIFAPGMHVDPSNISSSNKASSIFWWLVALMAIVMTMNLGWLELSAEEPRRAVVAWEMLASGDYIVPQAYGLEYYNKPPLYHWVLAAFMSIFGTSEFVVRLPGVLSFIAMAIVVYLAGKQHWGKTKAILPVIMLLSSADLLLYATVFSGEIDLFFSLVILCQAIGLFRIGQQPNRIGGYLVAYLALATAILTKGWSAIHFHVLTICVWAAYNHNFKALFNKVHAVTILSFIALISAYYYAFHLDGNLTNLLLNNFIESSSKVVKTSFSSILNQVTETPLVLVKISLPWTLLLLLLVDKKVRQSLKLDPLLIFSALFILSNIWIYWIFIDVRDRYLYPFIPFLCILLAGIAFYKKWWPEKRRLIFALVITMIVLRGLYNIFVIPRLVDDRLPNSFVYRQLVDSILIHTEGSQIDLLTPAVSYDLPFEVRGIRQIDKQPIIPYQIPYYLIRRTDHSPRLTNEIVRGKYYFVLDSQRQIVQAHDSLFQFTENWYQKNIILIRAR